jgi:hypothetical protein
MSPSLPENGNSFFGRPFGSQVTIVTELSRLLQNVDHFKLLIGNALPGPVEDRKRIK